MQKGSNLSPSVTKKGHYAIDWWTISNDPICGGNKHQTGKYPTESECKETNQVEEIYILFHENARGSSDRRDEQER